MTQMQNVIKEKGQQTLEQVINYAAESKQVRIVKDKSTELQQTAWDVIAKGKDAVNQGKAAVAA
eukprot:CAMPEP_0172749466 /NCGR_PEP_ID=MMETSP1074-20121228/147449_1 /TAXON_ID=2916 /ORGANISM="Ceratium fusus, Strain PA161109" /LENGTH=63 /DNA_ID=CAMNT_0013581443 /DNA_START=12 /DNA_END=199 /DNA_ORIENTATION=-